jgi:hypothetical protein
LRWRALRRAPRVTSPKRSKGARPALSRVGRFVQRWSWTLDASGSGESPGQLAHRHQVKGRRRRCVPPSRQIGTTGKEIRARWGRSRCLQPLT